MSQDTIPEDSATYWSEIFRRTSRIDVQSSVAASQDQPRSTSDGDSGRMTPRARSRRDHSLEGSKDDPNSRSRFLQMPVEIILRLRSFLSRPAAMLLAQTCRALRLIINNGLSQKSPSCYMSYEEQAEYLLAITRNRLDTWVHTCYDRPFVRRYGWNPAPLRRHEYEEQAIGFPDSCKYRINHIHMNIVLKYIRHWDTIGAKRQGHVHDILSSSKWKSTDYPRSGLCCIDPARLLGWVTQKWAYHPKVIKTRCPSSGADETRFMMRITRTFEPVRSREDIAIFWVCPHCRYSSEKWRLGERLNSEGAQYEPLLDMVCRVLELKKMSASVFGACGKCTTDFSVRIDSTTLVITSWHDWGGESSLLDPAWKSQSGYGSFAYLWRRPFYFWYYHVPGSVMKMYEEGESVVLPRPAESSRGYEVPSPMSLGVRDPAWIYVSTRLDRHATPSAHDIQEVGYPD